VRIIIAEDGYVSHIYGKALVEGFSSKGHDVYHFKWFEYFEGRQYKKEIRSFKDLFYKVQNKFRYGPVVNRINNDFVNFVSEVEPDLIFLYRNTHLTATTMSFIKKSHSKAKIFYYNNDDPFSKSYPKYFWRLFFSSLKYCDHIFSYRFVNINEYKSLNPSIPVTLLRSYYLKDESSSVSSLEKKYSSDVVFIGHFENDGRDEYLKTLVENGINLRIYGPEWHNSRHFTFLNKNCGPIRPIFTDYNLVLNSSKIALVFLSKRNRDTYTRRNFEIPATKTFMLSERTSDLENLFIPEVEASFFSSKQELLEKVTYYLQNDGLRTKVALRGYKRLLVDGHEVLNRCDQILKKLNLINDK